MSSFIYVTEFVWCRHIDVKERSESNHSLDSSQCKEHPSQLLFPAYQDDHCSYPRTTKAADQQEKIEFYLYETTRGTRQ